MKKEFLYILGIKNENEISNIDWKVVSSKKGLPEDFLIEFQDNID